MASDNEKPFEIQEQCRDDITILFAEGPMEKSELGLLEAALKRLMREGRKRVIVDFSEVTSLNSLNVAGIVICADSFQSNGGEMVVSGLSRALSNVFRVIDSGDRINLQTDVVAAIKSMSKRAAQP